MDIELVCLFRINRLPQELVREIYDFLPIKTRCILNKFLYQIFNKHYLHDAYIRHIIRKDLDYVFNDIVQKNFQNWEKVKKHKYKNKIFSNYTSFLNNICIEFNSTKCRTILQEVLTISLISKNRHKKNITKNIIKIINREWTN